MMKQLFSSSHLFGSNAPFIEELYETYLENPDGVSEEWQQYFDSLQNTPGGAQRDVAHYPVINAFADMAKRGPTRVVAGGTDKRQVSVLQLINAYRFLGNRWANLDPLKRTERPEIQELEPSYYGFTEGDLNATFNVGSFSGFAGIRPRCVRSSRRCGRRTAARSARNTCTFPISPRNAGSRRDSNRCAEPRATRRIRRNASSSA